MITIGYSVAPAGSSGPLKTVQVSPAPSGVYFDHLVVIMDENQGISQSCGGNPPPCNGANTPYMDSLANTYGIAQQYLALIGTSWPDYYGILGASIYGCPTNCYPPTGSNPATNLVDRFDAAGLTWKGYFETQSLSSGCAVNSNEPYTSIHNGFVLFQDIVNNSTRCSHLVLANPSGCKVTDCPLINDLNSSSAPNFMWLTPNDCDDMRGYSGCTNGCTSGGSTTCQKDGDNYMKSLVPNILNSKAFQSGRSALFITFDEGNGFCPLNGSSENCLYAVWAGPVAKTSYFSPNLYNHYSLTKTIEVNWNLPTLTSNDASATPMTEFFKADFSINSNPSNLTILAGNGSNATLNISSINGFAGTVTLGATSQPNGLGFVFNPASVTLTPGGTNTSTFTVNTISAGNYTAMITGTSGSLSHNTTLKAQVVDFRVSASIPSPANVGSTVSSSITVTSINRFTGRVSLQDSVSSGLSCGALNPNNINGSGTATVNCTATVAANYTVTVTGTSGSLLHSAAIHLQYQDFALTASPSQIAANNSTSVASNITISSLNGFAGTVNFASNSTSCTFTPTTVTGSGTAVLNCNGSTNNYAIAVTGTSGSLSHNTTLTVQVVDFTVSASPPSPANAGSSLVINITIGAVNGFTGTVQLGDTDPQGLSCGTVTPNSITGSGTATVTCTAPAGNYTLTVAAASGSLLHSVSISLRFQDFTVAASPSQFTVDDSTPISSTIRVTGLNGFAGIVGFATNRTSCTVTPSSVSGSGFAVLNCASSPSNYTVVVTGTSGALSHTFLVNVTVITGPVGGTLLPVDKSKLLYQYFPALALLLSLTVSGLVSIRRLRRVEDGEDRAASSTRHLFLTLADIGEEPKIEILSRKTSQNKPRLKNWGTRFDLCVFSR